MEKRKNWGTPLDIGQHVVSEVDFCFFQMRDSLATIQIPCGKCNNHVFYWVKNESTKNCFALLNNIWLAIFPRFEIKMLTIYSLIELTTCGLPSGIMTTLAPMLIVSNMRMRRITLLWFLGGENSQKHLSIRPVSVVSTLYETTFIASVNGAAGQIALPKDDPWMIKTEVKTIE